ncbi:MAG: hypothetical protein N839_0002210 [Desulfofustis sp. PB-SRB1]|nr:hypothetical protein [Desulfofustis sp. PB-SRB1]MBM1001205.1 hypothetical protein [Desulfofustis sp. PB-SRB1]
MKQSPLPHARLFTPRRRRINRTHISGYEVVSSVLVLLALAAVILWVVSRKNHFDPAHQDVSLEALEQVSGSTVLYQRPLKPWQLPGTTDGWQDIDLGIFPDSVASEQWRPKTRVKTFDPENLYVKINGEAERFLRHGFTQLSYLVLQSANQIEEISIELYNQGSIAGSTGIFAEHRSPESEVQQEGPNTFFTTSIGGIGRKGTFFYRISGNRSSESIAQKSRQLVQSFAELPDPENTEPFGYQLLQELTIEQADIRHQAVNVFQYDFAEDFWFGKSDGAGQAEMFVHQAQSPESAAELLAEIVEEHRYEYQTIRQTENLVLFQHRFLKSYFIIAIQDSFLFGADKTADEATSFQLLEMIGRALSKK